jgi:hypothetical protein
VLLVVKLKTLLVLLMGLVLVALPQDMLAKILSVRAKR